MGKGNSRSISGQTSSSRISSAVMSKIGYGINSFQQQHVPSAFLPVTATSSARPTSKAAIRRRPRSSPATTAAATPSAPMATAAAAVESSYIKAKRRRRSDSTNVGRVVSRTKTVMFSVGIMTFWALQLGAPAVAAADSISVVAPPALSAGDEFTVEWTYATDDPVRSERTTGDLYPFEINVRTCGEDGRGCKNGGCGVATTHNLCKDKGTAGMGVCMDSDGSVDVKMPSDTPAGDYVLRVTYRGPTVSSYSSAEVEEASLSACSTSFAISDPEIPAGNPVIAASDVDAPAKGFSPGDAFTARWAYDDGQGGGAGLFNVNLNSCEDGSCDDGSCGTIAHALCGSDGCYDPGPGDYDVRIPDSITTGLYKLEVSVDDIFACTDSAFNIVSSQPAAAAPTPAPVAPKPTAVPVPATTARPSKAPVTPKPTDAPITQLAPTPAPQIPVVAETPSPVAVADPVPSIPAGEPGSPGYPPTDMPIPAVITCNDAAVLKYSYKSSSDGVSSGLITISHLSKDSAENGCVNFTSLWEWLKTGPADVPTGLLYPVDLSTSLPNSSETATATGVWLLRVSVDTTTGVLFEVKGTSSGGDCDELRISSNGVDYHRLRGAGGHLYFRQTKVQSWNEDSGGEHTFSTDWDGATPRSHVVCLSERTEEGQTCSGKALTDRGDCRMDIIESEMGYLGYDDSESYGITWKVRGLCEDLSNLDTIFETTRVYGDLQDSDIHHMWYGMYSYGHLGGVWTDNLMHDNHQYGFDPHDDSDYLRIEGNTAFDNGNHGIIASKRCDHLLVKDNESYGNGASGIMLHQSCDDSVVSGNKAYENEAGLSLVETARTSVTDNEFSGNKWGVRLLVGATDNEIQKNKFDSNEFNDVLLYKSNDVPTLEPYTGINVGNIINDNTFTVTAKLTVDVEDSTDTTITNNDFDGTTGKFSFINATDVRVSGNTGFASAATHVVINSCFTSDSGLSPSC